MSSLQYRHSQKELLVKHKLPTAPYFELYGPGDLTPFFQTESQNDWVFKKNFGGYDGYGTFFWPKDSDLILEALTEAPQSQKIPLLIAEPLVKFKRELALTAARNKKNEIVFFPLVQTFQKNGQCDYVLGPTHHSELMKFKIKVKSFLKKLNYVGVITFELFDFEEKLLVNEVAPRVHNSAHFTLNATNISQFEMHWRCGLSLPLPEPKLTTPQFVMVNLVGTKNTKSLVAPLAAHGHLHWYGKSESRSRRKLGHVNFSGTNQKTLLNQALKERKKFNL
jgi:5-(carboxyamino)imidazole ribonucleotide synthase